MDQSTIQKAYVLQYSDIIILSLEVMCTQFIDLTIYMINMIDNNLYLALINTPEHCCTH